MLRIAGKSLAGYLTACGFIACCLCLTIAIVREEFDPSMFLGAVGFTLGIALLPFLLGRSLLWLIGAEHALVFAAAASGLAIVIGSLYGLPEFSTTAVAFAPQAEQAWSQSQSSVEEIIAAHQADDYRSNISVFNIPRILYWLLTGGVAGLIYHRIERGAGRALRRHRGQTA